MDFKITIDITERLEKSLKDLVKAIYCAGIVTERLKRDGQEKVENLAVETPKEPSPVIPPTDPENAPEAKSEPPVAEKPWVVEATAKNAQPVIDKALKSWVVAVASEQPEKKPAKKRTSKKAGNLPVDAPAEPAPVNTQPEAENASEAKSEPPAEAKQATAEPAADDPMEGMTIMQASQVILDEIGDRGLEMADVNARVRARAAEAGIAYSSITCLVKAIGYREARRVALNEK